MKEYLPAESKQISAGRYFAVWGSKGRASCLLRIVWSFTVFEQIGTLESLYIVFPVSWCVTVALIWAGYAAVRPLKQESDRVSF